MSQTNLIFIGIAGTVVALDRSTGSEVWRSKLGGDFANLFLQDGDLYAATKGEFFRLDPADRRHLLAKSAKGVGPRTHHYRGVGRPASRRHA